jgi:hypothetical protein
MSRTLQLAAVSLLLTGTQAHAQLHLHADKPVAEDLSWMWQYTQPAPGIARENALVGDARFVPFLEKNLKAPQTFFTYHGKHEPVSDVAVRFLSVPGEVIGEDNRYLTADGCLPHFCPDRGLLWVDLRPTRPLVVFAAIDWISDNKTTDDSSAAYTMWVFANRAVDPEHVPSALTRSIARWTAQPSSGSKDLQNITRVFFVDPDGTPHPVAPSAIGAHNMLPAETITEPHQSLNQTEKAHS